MAEWHPIETAPMDNAEDLLLWDGGYVMVGYFSNRSDKWYARRDSLDEIERVNPTHWQSLPEPPNG